MLESNAVASCAVIAWRKMSHRVLVRNAASCVLALAWCASGSPSPVPASQSSTAGGCTQPVPSYSEDIVPVLDRDCNNTCHAARAGRGAGPSPLTDWADVVAWSDAIAVNLRTGAMPPSDAGTLANGDKALVLDWLSCGAPDN